MLLTLAAEYESVLFGDPLPFSAAVKRRGAELADEAADSCWRGSSSSSEMTWIAAC